MRRSRIVKPTRMIAGLLSGLLLATLSIPLNAQTAVEPHAQRPLTLGYDKAHEITLNGTIQKLISQAASGGPVGLHLLVAGPQGTVDVHLGPYMTKGTQEALQAGTPVQIVGAIEKLHGKNYLLARQLIFAGRMVVVRSENGFLVDAHAPRATRPIHEGASQVEQTGGAR